MIPLFTGFFIFTIFQIPVAVAQNIETILICRFFQGLAGCAPLAIVGGALADIWNPVDRGVSISIFAAATFIGPVAGLLLLIHWFYGTWSNLYLRSYRRRLRYPISPWMALDAMAHSHYGRCFHAHRRNLRS
jgi:MFS family permease